METYTKMSKSSLSILELSLWIDSTSGYTRKIGYTVKLKSRNGGYPWRGDKTAYLIFKIGGQTVLDSGTKFSYRVPVGGEDVLASGTFDYYQSGGTSTNLYPDLYFNSDHYNEGNFQINGSFGLPAISGGGGSSSSVDVSKLKLSITGNYFGEYLQASLTNWEEAGFSMSDRSKVYVRGWYKIPNDPTEWNYMNSTNFKNSSFDNVLFKSEWDRYLKAGTNSFYVDVSLDVRFGSPTAQNYSINGSQRISLPAGNKPNVTGFRFVEQNTSVINSGFDGFIEGISNLKVIYETSSRYPITRYSGRIKNTNTYLNHKENDIGTLNASGSLEFIGSVTDNHNQKSSECHQTIHITPYSPPALIFNGKRDDNNQKRMYVTGSYQVCSLKNRGHEVNKCRMKLQYKKADRKDTWHTDKVIDKSVNDGRNTSFTEVFSHSFELSSSYDTRVVVEDRFTTLSGNNIVGTKHVLMSKTPHGIGIGKIRQNGELDVAGDAYFENVYVRASDNTNYEKLELNDMLQVIGANKDMPFYSGSWQPHDVKNGFYYISRGTSGAPSSGLLSSFRVHGTTIQTLTSQNGVYIRIGSGSSFTQWSASEKEDTLKVITNANIKDMGVYFCKDSYNLPKNPHYPYAKEDGVLVVQKYQNEIMQTLYPKSASGYIYTRKYNGYWYDWKHIGFTDEDAKKFVKTEQRQHTNEQWNGIITNIEFRDWGEDSRYLYVEVEGKYGLKETFYTKMTKSGKKII